MKRILRSAVLVGVVLSLLSFGMLSAEAHGGGHGGVSIGIGVGGPGYWGPGCGYRPYYGPAYYPYPYAPYYAYPAPYYAAPAYYPAPGPAYYPAPGGVIVGPQLRCDD
jgi:hypothetical protein